MSEPLLLLDVDGVLSLFGFDPRDRPAGQLVLVDGHPHLLSAEAAAHAAALCELFQLVWCTGWEDRADEHLPGLLGLPRGQPHLQLDAHRELRPGARHYKLAAIDAYAGTGRPLAWVDDDHDASCHAWARTREGPTRLVTTDPAAGLTAEHAAGLRAFAHALQREERR